MLLICLYVDDLLVTSSDLGEIEDFKEKMKTKFDMTDLGALSYFLGMEFLDSENGIILHQRKYVIESVEKI